MKIMNLVQGTPEWHAHRAAHFNASDAPAMLGVSPYKSRTQLLRECATGVAEELSDYAKAKVIDPGHAYEHLARAIAEEIIGEDLYPCVGVDGPYSASFDGLTVLGDTAYEHKSINEGLRTAFAEINSVGGDGSMLPELYRVQMEQQCMVSGAGRVLFMASRWTGDECDERHCCFYTPDPEMRARIIAGWYQFERDLAGLKSSPMAVAPPAPVGRTPESLPALRIEVTGMVTASNLAEFRDRAIERFRGIRTDLRTDQDFADAEETVKWCAEIEDKLKAAKDAALAQTESIDELFRAIDAISSEARAKRLELDRLVKSRKEQVRAEIVDEAVSGVIWHIGLINETLGEHAIGVPASLRAEIGAAIKGRRTIASITDAAQTAAANAKIAASQHAESIRACVAVLDEYAGHAHLFADRVQLCATKAPDDVRNLAESRVRADRERIQREAAAKAAADAAIERATAIHVAAVDTSDVVSSMHSPEGERVVLDVIAKNREAATVRLSEINAIIAPLSITAEGLAALGYPHVGTDRAAKLYRSGDVPAIINVMIQRLQSAARRE